MRAVRGILSGIGALVWMLSACHAFQPAREFGINMALLQPAEMGLGWQFEWNNETADGCLNRWSAFSRGFATTVVRHEILDCETVAAAQAEYERRMERAESDTLMGSRTLPGEVKRPAHADEFSMWCARPRVAIRRGNGAGAMLERICETVARYGRVISAMQVTIWSDTTWPLEEDLLKWAIDRNDERLAKLPE